MKEKLELKAALFDLDGVVFDTEPQYTVFWGSQCRLYHPEEPGLEQKIKGQTLDQIFDKHWNGTLVSEREAVTERLNSFEAQMTFDYVAGFEQFVSDLRAHGMKTAVVTSSNLIKMESVYRQRPEFKTLFDRILTSEDFTYSKPHPDCYLKAAGAFGLKPEQCIVFEDSVNGLKAGMAAEMTVVGLLTTNTKETVEQLSHYQTADYTNMNYQKLYTIWQDI
ncbi:MAG: HAD family hydrolase [Prevotella sp.]|nr:HAD family hydrolase [Prevotella sp.]